MPHDVTGAEQQQPELAVGGAPEVTGDAPGGGGSRHGAVRTRDHITRSDVPLRPGG